jgi:hypothetical protein
VRFVRLASLARQTGLVVLAMAMLLIGAWCSIAVWHRGGASEFVRDLLAGATLVLALFAVACLATRRRWVALTSYAAVVALFLAWWTTITPTNDRVWSPEIDRTVTATIDGDLLAVSNVRNFTWRSDTDFDQRWERRTYNLSHLTNVDLIMSYWMGETIAHTIISFGFDDSPRLAFSIETRKEPGEGFSSVAGFFKQYELAIVAADERDVVRVRSNVRGEDVRIYRLRMPRDDARLLLGEYVKEVNSLARVPRFYNTLTANCTTLVFELVKVIHPGLPMDPRVIMAGHLPDYAYELGAIDTSIPFEKLRELSKIHDKALLADADPNFSAKIREGIPAADAPRR